ncbi:hypothetical protein TrVE_jg12464 [Triparma verrucosa]|uniref:Uncharacterized protein n=1 Tax=Triparma verrucosa TaxID=1606542 RepID=A0A9W7ERK3_9STRA|nr:hypothetical protein TrVE_jg12464 [Triparma verrucosa]
MFESAFAFNQDLSSFNTAKVTSMAGMFMDAKSFDQGLLSFNTASVTDMQGMFAGATESTGLDACGFCANCPPSGGECLNGFKRVDSFNCDVCSEDTTKINDSCVKCPSNWILSSLLGFLVIIILALIAAVLYAFRNTRFMRAIEPPVNLKNLIRAKQIGAALQVLVIYAALSVSLSDWFLFIAEIFSQLSMPLEVKPVCTSWYESMARSEYYFLSAWIAFIVVYAVAFFLSSQKFKKIREEIIVEGRAETFNSEETIEDVERHGPYYAAFCLQYTPREYQHEEKAVVRKILWILGTKIVQFMAVVLANMGQKDNLSCARTAASSAALVAVNIWKSSSIIRDGEGEGDGGRDRGHTGVGEAVYGQIHQMVVAESYRFIIKLQSDLKLHTMNRGEVSRWSYEDKGGWTCARRFCGGMGFFLYGVGLYVGLMLCTGTQFRKGSLQGKDVGLMTVSTWAMTLLPSVLYLALEVLVWRAKKRWAHVKGDGDGDGGDGGDGDEENPVRKLEMVKRKSSTQL